MDDIELATLSRELAKDCAVGAAAATLAEQRFREASPSSYEGCAHHLARLDNVLEQMGRRVAKAFENTIDDEKGWHSELIRRLTLDIPGVRPAFWPEAILHPLRELRAFRHLFTNAYDLNLDPDKLRLLLKYANEIVHSLTPLAGDFSKCVATMHGVTPPDE
jgi:hypothetical protein